MQKALIAFSRVFVGSVFLLSGLIKANDAVGFSIKLDEYFSEGVFNLPLLQEYAYPIACFLCTVEILLGVALLLGSYIRLMKIGYMKLLIFFGFLTFYSAYFNKVTDCGCFGDALKFTPWESFTKDIVLLIAFLPSLFWYNKSTFTKKEDTIIGVAGLLTILVLGVAQFHWFGTFLFALCAFGIVVVLRIFSKRAFHALGVITALISSIAILYYTFQHLPIKDYRPYKEGADLKAGMTVPDDAPREITHVFVENLTTGEVVGTPLSQVPWSDANFKYREDLDPEIVQEGYEPPIHDFDIVNLEDEVLTDQILEWNQVLMVIAYDISKTDTEAWKQHEETLKMYLEKGYTVIGLSASAHESVREVLDPLQLYFPFYSCDETTLKTIVRCNPGFLFLEKGVVQKKWHFNDFEFQAF